MSKKAAVVLGALALLGFAATSDAKPKQAPAPIPGPKPPIPGTPKPPGVPAPPPGFGGGAGPMLVRYWYEQPPGVGPVGTGFVVIGPATPAPDAAAKNMDQQVKDAYNTISRATVLKAPDGHNDGTYLVYKTVNADGGTSNMVTIWSQALTYKGVAASLASLAKPAQAAASSAEGAAGWLGGIFG